MINTNNLPHDNTSRYAALEQRKAMVIDLIIEIHKRKLREIYQVEDLASDLVNDIDHMIEEGL